MFIRVGFDISLDCDGPTPLQLALYTHPREARRRLGDDRIQSDPVTEIQPYIDDFGNRKARLVAPPGPIRLQSNCTVEDDGRPDIVDPTACQHAVEDLPEDCLPYLVPSRYCESDLLMQDAWNRFGQTPEGWHRVQAICDFVHGHVKFGYAFGRPTKTAADALREGNGVCRDYAHLAIALCRAMNIPARYASGYLGDIGVPPAGPGDFCAWFEAYLDGRWYTFDARYNTPRIGRVLMVRGRDAADVPMITSFGSYRLTNFEVWCDEVARPALRSDMPVATAFGSPQAGFALQ
jgi:transglutaminase-like putative cysteine protease